MMRLVRQRQIVSPNTARHLMNPDEHPLRTCLEVSPIECGPVPADIVSHIQRGRVRGDDAL